MMYLLFIYIADDVDDDIDIVDFAVVTVSEPFLFLQ